MTPKQWYRKALDEGQLEADSAQAELFELLEQTHAAVCELGRADGAWASLKRLIGREAPKKIRGLYIWGGVGRGKTLAMDVFYDALPIENKVRMHFHSFMQRVHADLKEFEGAEPLSRVAQRLTQEAAVLCLDEFQVSDIADAMILAGLLRELFARDMVLVTTSNTEPDSLYQDGLQRAQFIPAIELLRTHTNVIHLGGDVDYRLRTLEKAQVYHYPLDDEAERSMSACFEALCPINVVTGTALVVSGREIAVVAHAEGVLWLQFIDLCDGPRGNADYIEIARRFHTVLLSNVPQLDDSRIDQVARFIHAIDEFYDRHVNLIVSAQVAPDALYQGTKLSGAFTRTASRLMEMRSHGYLAHAHALRSGGEAPSAGVLRSAPRVSEFP